MVERREFLSVAAQLSALGLLRCNTDGRLVSPSDDAGDAPSTPSAPDAAAERDCSSAHSTELLPAPILPFDDENGVPFGVPLSQGWDGRLYTDLSRLAPGETLTSSDDFYVRTHYPDTLNIKEPWSLTLGGLVSESIELSPTDIRLQASDQGVHLLECAGNHRSGGFGLMSAAQWEGVPLTRLLEVTSPLAAAKRITVTGYDEHSMPSAGGHSTPGASWSFSLAEIEETGAFIATKMNGELLPAAHGYPLRLIVPGWYGCTCIKWVNSIAWTDENTAATSQMMEFAQRTHQTGQLERAKDYHPARIQQAAMPIRVQQLPPNGELVFQIVGILWGGELPTRALELSCDGGSTFHAVDLCPPVTQTATWSLWSHLWRPARTGAHDMVCRIPDPSVAMQRLDAKRYMRSVTLS